jgi:NAD(P)H-dependent FMN reductase
MKIFQNKPMVIMATSPGPGGGARVLKAANESAATFGADVLGSVAIPSFYKNFDVDKGEILDAALAQELNAHLFKLKTVKG